MEHTATELQREDLQEKKEICSDSCPICKGTGWELFTDENGRDVMREKGILKWIDPGQKNSHKIRVSLRNL